MKKYLNHYSLSSLTLTSLYSAVSLRQALLLLRKKKSRIGSRIGARKLLTVRDGACLRHHPSGRLALTESERERAPRNLYAPFTIRPMRPRAGNQHFRANGRCARLYGRRIDTVHLFIVPHRQQRCGGGARRATKESESA